MPTNGRPNGRFELPQLTPISFSLTDGTSIPPPPISPIEEKPPPVAPKRELSEESVTSATNGTANGTSNGKGNGTYDGRGRTPAISTSVSIDHKPPMSPVSTNRPSSIRRFLSRKSLNTNYENGTNNNISNEDLAVHRPDSAMSFASTKHIDKKSRPSWFRRFSSTKDAARTSVIYEEKRTTVAPMGPPPPKLPELSKIGAKIPEDDEGSLGGEDMFKNIK